MQETLAPSARAAVLTAFLVGLAMVLLDPFSFGRVTGLLRLLAGAAAVVLVAALAAMFFGRNEMPEEEFRRIAERSEELAKLPPGEQPLSEFDELVVGGDR